MKLSNLLLFVLIPSTFALTSCQDDMKIYLEADETITRVENDNSVLIDYYWYQGEKIPIK